MSGKNETRTKRITNDKPEQTCSCKLVFKRKLILPFTKSFSMDKVAFEAPILKLSWQGIRIHYTSWPMQHTSKKIRLKWSCFSVTIPFRIVPCSSSYTWKFLFYYTNRFSYILLKLKMVIVFRVLFQPFDWFPAQVPHTVSFNVQEVQRMKSYVLLFVKLDTLEKRFNRVKTFKAVRQGFLFVRETVWIALLLWKNLDIFWNVTWFWEILSISI